MLCLGPSCTSAVFVSCSSTLGANVFRVRKDPQLADDILSFLERFSSEFAGKSTPPPADFFWGSDRCAQCILRSCLLLLLRSMHLGVRVFLSFAIAFDFFCGVFAFFWRMRSHVCLH